MRQFFANQISTCSTRYTHCFWMCVKLTNSSDSKHNLSYINLEISDYSVLWRAIKEEPNGWRPASERWQASCIRDINYEVSIRWIKTCILSSYQTSVIWPFVALLSITTGYSNSQESSSYRMYIIREIQGLQTFLKKLLIQIYSESYLERIESP